MGFSRIYFAVHYFTDVLAAFVVGACAAVAAVLLIKLLTKSAYFSAFLNAKGIIGFIQSTRMRKQ